MEDRIFELKRIQVIPAVSEVPANILLGEFHTKVNNMQYWMNKVRENSRAILQLKDQHVKSTLNEQEKVISSELERVIDENTKLCKLVKQDLETLDLSVVKAKESEPDEPETRIKEITLRSLQAKFAEVLKESQSVQLDYKQAVRGKMARQIRVIDPTLNAEQVEDVMNDPDGAGNLMASKVIGQGHIKLRNAVADIKDKQKDIRKLEISVQLIHQMFVDMALLVQAQGELLDNIELNVQNAENYMKKANVQLGKAKKWHQKRRKLMCCVCIILLILLAVVIAVPIAVSAAH